MYETFIRLVAAQARAEGHHSLYLTLAESNLPSQDLFLAQYEEAVRTLQLCVEDFTKHYSVFLDTVAVRVSTTKHD